MCHFIAHFLLSLPLTQHVGFVCNSTLLHTQWTKINNSIQKLLSRVLNLERYSILPIRIIRSYVLKTYGRCNKKSRVLINLIQEWMPLGYWMHHTACMSFWMTKDKPFLLMQSRHARKLYDPKIKRIFEIAWTLFKIILFIHFYPLKNKHLDGARNTIWKKL